MVATASTSGTQARIDCLTASRTIVAQRTRPFSAFAPSQRETERAADQGTMRSTPSSVAACTASSSRSPFASACTRVMRGDGAASTCTSSTSSSRRRGSVAVTIAAHDASAPVADRDPLAGAHPRDRDRVARLVAVEHDGRAGGHAGEVERLVEVEAAHRGIRQPRNRSRRRREEALLEVPELRRVRPCAPWPAARRARAPCARASWASRPARRP